MRIGIDATIISNLKNGVGVYALNLVRELAKVEGIHLTVFVQKGKERLWPDIPPAKIDVISGPRGHKLSRFLYEQIEMPRLCRAAKLDLLHSLNYTAPLSRLPCPSVVTVHDLTTFLFPNLRALVYRIYMHVIVLRSVKQARRILAPSVSTKHDMMRLFGLPDQLIDVSPLAFDASVTCTKDESFMQATLRKYGIRRPYFLYVGRLDASKNLPRLIEAFALLRKDHRFTGDLVLAGRPWNDSRNVARCIERFDLKDHVHVTGHLPDDEINALYTGARVFAFPSLYEGFGIPILEAMNCNLPVLTSNVSSLPEVGGDAVVAVDPHNAHEMANALLRVATDNELRARLIQAGHARCEHYRWAGTIHATLGTYRTVLREAGKPMDGPNGKGV